MPSGETFFAFSLAAFLLSIAPGPSNLYIMARSINQGTGAGIAAASGMAIGSVIYVVLSALGLAAIFKHAPALYLVVKLVGAVYLIYLGFGYLKSQAEDKPVTPEVNAAQLNKIFLQSIIVELTNPKTALFFLAFLPQFVFADQGNVTLQFIILGLTYALIALACDILVATLSGRFGAWLKNNPTLLHYQDKLSGGLLVTLGGWIGLKELLR